MRREAPPCAEGDAAAAIYCPERRGSDPQVRRSAVRRWGKDHRETVGRSPFARDPRALPTGGTTRRPIGHVNGHADHGHFLLLREVPPSPHGPRSATNLA